MPLGPGAAAAGYPLHRRQMVSPRRRDARRASLRTAAPAVSGFHGVAFLRGGMTAWRARAVASWHLRVPRAPSAVSALTLPISRWNGIRLSRSGSMGPSPTSPPGNSAARISRVLLSVPSWTRRHTRHFGAPVLARSAGHRSPLQSEPDDATARTRRRSSPRSPVGAGLFKGRPRRARAQVSFLATDAPARRPARRDAATGCGGEVLSGRLDKWSFRPAAERYLPRLPPSRSADAARLCCGCAWMAGSTAVSDDRLEIIHAATSHLPGSTEAERRVVQCVRRDLFRPRRLEDWGGCGSLTSTTGRAPLPHRLNGLE